MHGDQNHGHSVAGPMPSDRMWWGRQWGLGPVRRSQGDSFVALVSFITGIAIIDERTGARCSPNHPNKLPGYIVAAPKGAPASFTDRRRLSSTVNDIERSEMLHNSIVGHYWLVIADPQHSEFDHFAAVLQVANEIANRYRVFVVAGIDKTDGGQTMQYHFACNVRRIDANGIGPKVKQINLMECWAREQTWFSRAVAAAIIQNHGIVPREEEKYEQEIYENAKSWSLKSIRRRAFRNRPWAFANVLKLKDVEGYLKRAFPGVRVVTSAYNIIHRNFTEEDKEHLNYMGFRNAAEVFARLLVLPGVREHLQTIFQKEQDTKKLFYAYRLIDETDLPTSWEAEPRTIH